MANEHMRFDVVLATGKYAGACLNREPLAIADARKLANEGSQRGRPEIRPNFDASIKALDVKGKAPMNTNADIPLTHPDLKPLIERIALLETALRGRDRDIEELEARVAALEQADRPTIVQKVERNLLE